MYDLLTSRELIVLQEMLFEATEEAHRLANLKRDDPDWFASYHPLHRDVGYLFIEAGTALLRRLDQRARAA